MRSVDICMGTAEDLILSYTAQLEADSTAAQPGYNI